MTPKPQPGPDDVPLFDRERLLQEALKGQIQELSDWWMQLATMEAAAVAPKAVEYGGHDLAVMGRAMAGLWPGERKLTEVEGMELACAFYALGKVARLFGSYERGELPSDDTWHDLGVYCRMAQRIRATGGWPGG